MISFFCIIASPIPNWLIWPTKRKIIVTIPSIPKSDGDRILARKDTVSKSVAMRIICESKSQNPPFEDEDAKSSDNPELEK